MYFTSTLIHHISKRNFSFSISFREKFGCTSEDATYILSKINDQNNLSGNLIGAANKKRLETHIKQNGQFEVLEDLLQVHGLGPKSIKRICDKLLLIRGNPEEAEVTRHTESKRFRLPVITPPLSEAQASIIKTVGSINIGPNEITWTKVNCISKNLDVWESLDLHSYSLSKKIDLITLILICKDIVERLPVCDTYVLEDLSNTSYGGSSSGLPRSTLTSIIATLVHQPPSGGIPKVVLVGSRAVAKWSGRLVGSEKVSSQSLIEDIIVKLNESSGGLCSENMASIPVLYAEPLLRSIYLSSQPAVREALADAVLLALAFVDLAVHRRETMNRLPHR